MPGITLFMQPVQDLSVEDRVSRTQFQYTLEDPNVDELNTFAPQMLARLQKLPELSDVASDQQILGLRAKLVFDRNTAARFGITSSAIDQTLYDAYGQRQISTMFTQLNQYHVVLEVQPGFREEPVGFERPLHPERCRRRGCADWRGHWRVRRHPGRAGRGRADPVLVDIPDRRPDPAQRVLSSGNLDRADHGEPSGPVSRGDAVLQPRAGHLAGSKRSRPSTR